MKRTLYLALFLLAANQALVAQHILLNRSGGNVGIGTTSPSAKLHVVGTTNLGGATQITGPALSYTAGSGVSGGALSVGNTSTSPFFLGGSRLYLEDNQLQVIYTPAIYDPPSSAPAPSVLLLNPLGGNVGIGTTSPTYKLAVNGTIRAKELIVESGWADFVFASTYRLRPLSEVERFIKKHHHLPDIEPASNIAQQGVPVAETTTKLLQKIEELTLYVIAQQKQLAAQQRQIRQLQTIYRSPKNVASR